MRNETQLFFECHEWLMLGFALLNPTNTTKKSIINLMKQLLTGNEAAAEAALQAGCRYYYGYPITPQNELINYMSVKMPQLGGTFIQQVDYT